MNKSTTKLSSKEIQTKLTEGDISAANTVKKLKSDLNSNVKTAVVKGKTVAQANVGGKALTIITNSKDIPITESNKSTGQIVKPSGNNSVADSGLKNVSGTGSSASGEICTGSVVVIGNDNIGTGGIYGGYGRGTSGSNSYNPLTDNQPFYDFLNKNDYPIVTFGSTNVNLFGTLNTALGLFDTSLPNSFSGSSWDVTVGKYTWTDNTSGNSNDGYQVGFVWHPNQKDDKSSNADKLDDTFGLQPKNPDKKSGGTSSTTQNSDGSTTIKNSDGSSTKIKPDGSSVTVSADKKTVTYKDKNGKVTETRTTNSDGSVTVTDKNGNKTTTGLHDDYGNPQAVSYDAKTQTTTTVTYTHDGTNGTPAVVMVTTDKQGNKTTSVVTTNSNGETVTIWVDEDGNTHQQSVNDQKTAAETANREATYASIDNSANRHGYNDTGDLVSQIMNGGFYGSGGSSGAVEVSDTFLGGINVNGDSSTKPNVTKQSFQHT